MDISQVVITGCVDGFVDSTGGSAPQNYGFHIVDSIVADSAWWYTPTVNSIIHPSDTQSHGDGVQKSSTLAVTIENTTLLGYISDVIGTGTPGSGSDAGNTYVPATGYNFIATQAQMETWRSTYGSYLTDPAQSGSLVPIWDRFALHFAQLEYSNPSYDVVVDCGRLAVNAPPWAVLCAADAVVLVLRPTLQSISAALPAAEAVQALLDELEGAAEPAERAPATQLAVTEGIGLHGVTYRYPGAAAPALRDVTLSIPAGRVRNDEMIVVMCESMIVKNAR
jgi:ABC-type multidrug transport system fused ATPase/permease subunit